MTMVNRTEAAANGESGIDSGLIRTVSVELEALLGTARMTVGELAALRVGEVVALAAPLNQPIALRLNGVTVALGELVSVDARFGVRLTEIVPWSG